MKYPSRARPAAERRVDHQVDLPAADQLRHVVGALAHLRHALDRDARRARSTPAVPPVASSRNPRSARRLAGNTIARLSRFATLTNTVPLVGSACPGRDHRLRERHARIGVDPHDLAGRLHLRARARCRRPGTVRTAAPPPSRSCTAGAGSGADRPAAPRRRRARRASGPVSTSVAIRASETPITFETNGTVRDARGFASSTQMRSSLTASCRLSSPTHARAGAPAAA